MRVFQLENLAKTMSGWEGRKQRRIVDIETDFRWWQSRLATRSPLRNTPEGPGSTDKGAGRSLVRSLMLAGEAGDSPGQHSGRGGESLPAGPHQQTDKGGRVGLAPASPWVYVLAPLT